MLVMMIIEDMLAELGCTSVSAAATVEEALALIEAEVFDVAMLDINLDGSKSHSVADALALRGVPFAFATGYIGNDMREGYRDRPILKKPLQSELVAATLARLLS